MRFLRSVLCVAFYLMFGTGGVVFSLLLAFPVPRSAARRLLADSFRFFVLAGVKTGLFRIDVSEADRLRLLSLRGTVVAANHVSLIDAVILMSLLGDSVCVAKPAVAGNPFMGVVARRVLIVGGDPYGVLGKAKGSLSAGVNVAVFPEGTRTPPDDPRHVFRRGAAHIALQAGAPVELVHISCTPRVLGKGQPWWDAGASPPVYSIRCMGRIGEDEVLRLRRLPGGGRRAAAELTSMMHERMFGS